MYCWTLTLCMSVCIILRVHSFCFCIFFTAFCDNLWRTDTELIAVEVKVPNQRRLLFTFYSNSDCSRKYVLLQLRLCLLFLKLAVFCFAYDEPFLTKLLNFDSDAKRRRGYVRLTLTVTGPNDLFTSFRDMKYG